MGGDTWMGIENLLPEINLDDLNQEADSDFSILEVQGYLTPLFDFKAGEFIMDNNGVVQCDDSLEGMKVLIHKAQATIRDKYVIYGENYGSDAVNILTEFYPKESKKLMLGEAIRDCIIFDDRIVGISEIELTRDRDSYIAKYTVYTIFGDIAIEMEVV